MAQLLPFAAKRCEPHQIMGKREGKGIITAGSIPGVVLASLLQAGH
jgi:hypothetical protein